MKKVPVVFTFDNNLSFPAAVCIDSLMRAASPNTFYDIFILHSGAPPKILGVEKIQNMYPNMSIKYRSVGDAFENAYEIRGITKTAYYRLLAADLIPEYNMVIYADVDTIFRMDLSGLLEFDLADCYMGAVYALGINTKPNERKHLRTIGLEQGNYFVSGFLLMDLLKIRKDGLVKDFIRLSKNNYKYQDQDIINIVCAGKIAPLPYVYHMAVEAYEAVSLKTEKLHTKYLYNPCNINPFLYSNIHYNGAKPWKDWCPNLDQWWEAYRHSAIYDPTLYFTFFKNKLEYLDQLSLLKRIKVLVRFFVFGRKKIK